MKLYKITKLGKKAARNRSGSAEELRLLDHLWNNGPSTEEELEAIGEVWMVRRMSRGEGKLIREMTE